MTTEEYLRKKKFGKLDMPTEEEIARKERESQLQAQAELAHSQWNRGMKQVKDTKAKMESDLHEMGKSFARSSDDKDMNDALKEVMREEDPMFEYMMKKKPQKNIMPTYQGSFPPNRFNIRPGYRWDGVDRSNGFEKEWFEKRNNKRAENDDSYKYCSADM